MKKAFFVGLIVALGAAIPASAHPRHGGYGGRVGIFPSGSYEDDHLFFGVFRGWVL